MNQKENEYEVFVNGFRLGTWKISTCKRPFIWQLMINAEKDGNNFASKNDADGNKVWVRLKNKKEK